MMSSYNTDFKKDLILVMEINNDLSALDIRKNSLYRFQSYEIHFRSDVNFLRSVYLISTLKEHRGIKKKKLGFHACFRATVF